MSCLNGIVTSHPPACVVGRTPPSPWVPPVVPPCTPPGKPPPIPLPPHSIVEANPCGFARLQAGGALSGGTWGRGGAPSCYWTNPPPIALRSCWRGRRGVGTCARSPALAPPGAASGHRARAAVPSSSGADRGAGAAVSRLRPGRAPAAPHIRPWARPGLLMRPAAGGFALCGGRALFERIKAARWGAWSPELLRRAEGKAARIKKDRSSKRSHAVSCLPVCAPPVRLRLRGGLAGQSPNPSPHLPPPPKGAGVFSAACYSVRSRFGARAALRAILSRKLCSV